MKELTTNGLLGWRLTVEEWNSEKQAVEVVFDRGGYKTKAAARKALKRWADDWRERRAKIQPEWATEARA